MVTRRSRVGWAARSPRGPFTAPPGDGREGKPRRRVAEQLPAGEGGRLHAQAAPFKGHRPNRPAVLLREGGPSPTAVPQGPPRPSCPSGCGAWGEWSLTSTGGRGLPPPSLMSPCRRERKRLGPGLGAPALDTLVSPEPPRQSPAQPEEQVRLSSRPQPAPASLFSRESRGCNDRRKVRSPRLLGAGARVQRPRLAAAAPPLGQLSISARAWPPAALPGAATLPSSRIA